MLHYPRPAGPVHAVVSERNANGSISSGIAGESGASRPVHEARRRSSDTAIPSASGRDIVLIPDKPDSDDGSVCDDDHVLFRFMGGEQLKFVRDELEYLASKRMVSQAEREFIEIIRRLYRMRYASIVRLPPRLKHMDSTDPESPRSSLSSRSSSISSCSSPQPPVSQQLPFRFMRPGCPTVPVAAERAP